MSTFICRNPHVDPVLLGIINHHRWYNKESIQQQSSEEDPDDPGGDQEVDEGDAEEEEEEEEADEETIQKLRKSPRFADYEPFPLDKLDKEAEHLEQLFTVAPGCKIYKEGRGMYSYDPCTYAEHYARLDPGMHPLPRNIKGEPIFPTIGDVLWDMLSLHPTRVEIPGGLRDNCWCVTLAPLHHDTSKVGGIRDFISSKDEEGNKIGPVSKSELRGFESANSKWVCVKGDKNRNPDGSYKKVRGGKTVGPPIVEVMTIRRLVGTLASKDGTKRYSRIDFLFGKEHKPHAKRGATHELRLTFFVGQRSDVSDNPPKAHGNVKRTKKEAFEPLSEESKRFVLRRMGELRSANQIYQDAQKEKPYNVKFRGVEQISRIMYLERRKIEEEAEKRRHDRQRGRPTYLQKAAEAFSVMMRDLCSKDENGQPANNIRHMRIHSGGDGLHWSYTNESKQFKGMQACII